MITKITDLRTGYRHPERNELGQYISRKAAARYVHWVGRRDRVVPAIVVRAPRVMVLDHAGAFYDSD